MTEPRKPGLAAARAALHEAEGRVPRRQDLDDYDPDEVARERAETMRDLREEKWRRLCPQRFHRASLDWVATQHGSSTLATIREWQAQTPRPNLLLTGPVGTGKTGTALAAVHDDFVEHGLDVEFWPTVEMLDALRPGGIEGTFDGLVDVGRLIVDDLGAERPTDWTAERLYAVVNRRWLEERPIVVTANLSTADLREVVGPRMYSRLVGDDAYVIELLGEDRRRA